MSTIFDPIYIKNIKIPNRIVLPPLVRFSIIGSDGNINEKLLSWYESIARGGVGLIIVEATAVDKNGKLRDNQLGIWDDGFIPGLKQISDIVHRYGSKIMIQLHHAGFRQEIANVAENILDDILDKFTAAFYRAKKAGFDGIEIHGAHTYLLSQLASPLWNTRTDKYGGTFEKRMYFAKTLIERTRDLFNENFILGYRMGGNEPSLENGIKIAQYLEKAGINLLHVSSGVPDPIYKQEVKIPMPEDFPLDWVVYMGTEIKKYVNIPVIGVRRIKLEKEASWLIENNMLDMVAIGRAMISDPCWMEKAKESFEQRNGAPELKKWKKTIDIFCEIIDNYGDIGVVYRLAKALKHKYKHKVVVRIILNRLNEFLQIEPKASDTPYQGINDIVCMKRDHLMRNINDICPGDIVIEAFGCGIPDKYMEKACERSKLIINMEYLTGESWAEDFHLKSSPIGKGTAQRIFYMPGFSEKTGGVIIDTAIRDKVRKNPEKYIEKYFGDFEDPEKRLKGTIFSYEKNFLPLLDSLQKTGKDIALLIMGSKSQCSFEKIFKDIPKKIFGNIYKYGRIHMKFQEFLSQDGYEEAINVADFNFVRGEDSVVRAILTGKPFLWHIYCQEDLVHMKKLDAFLDIYSKCLIDNGYEFTARKLADLFQKYNYRQKDSFDQGNEDYDYFFEDLENIKKANMIFSEFLGSKCDLINKLKKSIDESFRR